jgi:uncharacterized protein YndB with AHSA1/START domain
MPHTADATLQDEDGRCVLRFERTFPFPPERVWSALTSPDEQPAWHPTPFRFEPRVGGTVRYLSSDELPEGRTPPGMQNGVVTEYDPPRVLAHSWDTDELRWEVSPHDDGCRLVLLHTFDDRFKAARDATGWTYCLDALTGALELGTAAPTEIDQGLPKEWNAVNAAYEKRFGIEHAEATPPPSDR